MERARARRERAGEVHALRLERAEALLDAKPNVLVVGDLMLDRYIRGHVDRVSPEAPVPVVRVEAIESGLGGAANVAANVQGVGATTSIVGVLGDDEAGQIVLEGLEALEIEARALYKDVMRPTTTKTRVTAQRQQVVRFDEESDEPLSSAVERHIVEAVRDRATACDVLVVEDYDKGVLTPGVIDATLAAAHAVGVPVVVDPKRRSFFGYGGATVFKPNARELADALGEPVAAHDPVWMERAHRRVGARHLLLTRGAEGMALFDEEGLALLPASARAVYDVSGAGDTVTAVLAVALAGGATTREAAELANLAAGVTVARSGVAPMSRDRLLSAVEADNGEVSHPDP